MYQINLFENGRFCTQVGGPIRTLTETLDQLKRVAETVDAKELKGYVGYWFDRAGTDCALVITDRFGMFLTDADIVED